MRWWVGTGCGANPPYLLKAWFDLMGKILGLFSFGRVAGVRCCVWLGGYRFC